MNTEKDKTPDELLSLAADTQGGFDDIGKLPNRLERYGFARKRALSNLSQVELAIKSPNTEPLFKRHLTKLQLSLAACGNWLLFKHYYTIGTISLAGASFCKAHLLCPLCAIRRASKALEAYLQRYEIIRNENPRLKLSMLTLTVKNGSDLAERFQHLQKSVSLVLARRSKARANQRGHKSEFAKILGLVGSYEVTKDGGKGAVKKTGWHPHAHIMVLHTERFDYRKLQAEWLKITGDSHVLNVTPAKRPKEPAQDFLEVFKYAVKYSSLTPQDNLEVYQVLRGKRLIFSAGLFRGVKEPESLLDDTTNLEDLPYFEMFYRYIVGSGYNIVLDRYEKDTQ